MSVAHDRGPSRSAARWVCMGALLLPFAFYFYTSAPGIGMGDTALLVESAYWLDLSTHAAVHNIAILIGKLFMFLPGYDPARDLNLASAFTGGVAVLLYGLLLLRVLRSKGMALACTGLLMVSRSMWWHSTIAESYAVNALFTVGALWLLFAPGRLGPGRIVSLFFIGALAIFNHAQMGIIAVGATVSLVLAGLAMLRGPGRSTMQRLRHVVTLGALCSLAFLIGLLPWLLVFRRQMLGKGLANVVSRSSGAEWKDLMFRGDVWKGLTDTLYLVFEQFPGPFLLAVPVGLVLLTRRYLAGQFLPFFAMLGINTVFFALYDTWDRYAFLLPSFILLAFAGSLAVDALWERASKSPRLVARGIVVAALLFSLLFSPWFYSRLSDWGSRPGFWAAHYGGEHHGNLVNFAEYLANPNKRHWNDAEEYAQLLFARLPQGATYIDDDSRTYFPLQYFRRYFHERLDLKIFMINSWGFENWGLDRAEFAQQMLQARRTHGQFFIPSLGHPYDRFIPSTMDSRPPEFEIYRLDDRRHVYRLVTERGQVSHSNIGPANGR